MGVLLDYGLPCRSRTCKSSPSTGENVACFVPTYHADEVYCVLVRTKNCLWGFPFIYASNPEHLSGRSGRTQDLMRLGRCMAYPYFFPHNLTEFYLSKVYGNVSLCFGSEHTKHLTRPVIKLFCKKPHLLMGLRTGFCRPLAYVRYPFLGDVVCVGKIKRRPLSEARSR